MTIIVFLVDTSASMNQRCYLGTSLLDVAKSAIETFLKIRARDASARGMDRYMLLTFEDSPKNIKAVFGSELRGLRAAGETELGPALGSALDLLNINRLQSGIDNYGQGRYPHWLEPAVVVTITDGDRLSPSQTNPNPQMIPSDVGPLDPMCEVTGGRSYCIRSHKALSQCLESLAAKMGSGIVVSLEKFGADPPPPVTKEEPLTNGYVDKPNGVKTELHNGNHDVPF